VNGGCGRLFEGTVWLVGGLVLGGEGQGSEDTASKKVDTNVRTLICVSSEQFILFDSTVPSSLFDV
jgi:hypothetical protein